MEWHLLANHVQKNLHGIYCASALFAGLVPERLRAWSAVLLAQQLREQVLDDGMHFERSPMYHRLVLADYREAAAVAAVVGGQPPVPDSAVLDRMAAALRRFVRSDGSLHLFNDAANGAETPLARGSSAAPPAAPGCWSLPDAGYYGRRTDRYSFILDCGEPGPPYQAAHAHCDLLSFELDLNDVPFVVDSGTSGYDGDPLRAYVRSTRAHNTVQLAQLEQHEIWGTFRVARRARIRHARFDEDGGRFVGAYSPYAAPDVVHERIVELRDRQVAISDRMGGAPGGVVRSFLHFHPDVSIRTDGGTLHASSARRGAVIETSNIAAMRIIEGAEGPVQGWYAPAFGVRIPAPVVEFVVADAAEPFGYTITF